MFIRDLHDCEEFIAGDGSLLRELLHPAKSDLSFRYSLVHAVIKPGQTTKPHRLKTSEVYYILEGEGMMHINDETAMVSRGQAVYIPPGSVQYIKNTEKAQLKFLCIVDPAWQMQDEEIL